MQDAQKAKDVFNGRQFDGNTISASLVSDDDFNKAVAGLWTGATAAMPAAVPQPLSPAGECTPDHMQQPSMPAINLQNSCCPQHVDNVRMMVTWD